MRGKIKSPLTLDRPARPKKAAKRPPGVPARQSLHESRQHRKRAEAEGRWPETPPDPIAQKKADLEFRAYNAAIRAEQTPRAKAGADHPPASPAEFGRMKQAKLAEQVRQLQIANDTRAGLLVPRAWVVERMQRAGGDLRAQAAKWEAELPLRLASAGSDVAANRKALRLCIEEMVTWLSTLETHFKE